MGAIVNNQVFRDYKPVSCEPGDIVFFREEFDIDIRNNKNFLMVADNRNQKVSSRTKFNYLYGKVIQADIKNEICRDCKKRKCRLVKNRCKYHKEAEVDYVKLDMTDYCKENNINEEYVAEYFKNNNDVNINNGSNLTVLIHQVLSSFDIVFIIRKNEVVKNLDGTDNAEVKKQILKSIMSNVQAKFDIRIHVRKKMQEEDMQKEREEAAIVEDCEPHMLKIIEGNPIRYKCVKCNGLFNWLRHTMKRKVLIFCEKCNDFKERKKMIRSEKFEDMIKGNYGTPNHCIVYRICKACGEVDRKEAQRIREENIRREKEERKRKRCKEVIKEFPSLKDVGFLGM